MLQLSIKSRIENEKTITNTVQESDLEKTYPARLKYARIYVVQIGILQ